jgi:hypothetical protein
VIIQVDRILPVPLLGVAGPVHRAGCPRLAVPNLARVWSDWRSALLIVKPETVVAWHRKGFRVVVFGERSLRRTLTSYCAHYHQWRTQLSLDKAVPQSRKRQRPAKGPVIEVPEVGGLHHHYERQAA